MLWEAFDEIPHVINFVLKSRSCPQLRRIWTYQRGNIIRIQRRRTDNTMAKRKRTNNDLQNIHIKLNIK